MKKNITDTSLDLRGSRYDFPFSRPGRTAFALLLYLGHMGNVTDVVPYLLSTTKAKLCLGYKNPEECLADQGRVF